ncbi:hypothetical protein [Jonesia quinghaiensis]|uniref:hypothetical protein n=1 Tax=Jonesia quinghaiensis TaxID=262806 RepID=UPI0004054187|nr:hypothetical protein [Jonesia quinghaiensis]
MSHTHNSSQQTTAGSPWLTTRFKPLVGGLIVVDILLIVLAVVFAVNTFAGGPSQDPPAVATTEPQEDQDNPDEKDEDSTESDEPAEIDVEASGAKSFASPSGNISCTVSALGVECGIGTLENAPEPNVAGCEGYIGYVAQLNGTGVIRPCVPEEALPGAADSSAKFLEYGEKYGVNNFTCVSERTGMKCTDANTGRGFNIARAGITEF